MKNSTWTPPTEKDHWWETTKRRRPGGITPTRREFQQPQEQNHKARKQYIANQRAAKGQAPWWKTVAPKAPKKGERTVTR